MVGTLRKAIEGGRTGPRVEGKLPIYLAGVSRPMVKLAGDKLQAQVAGALVNLGYRAPEAERAAANAIAAGAQGPPTTMTELVKRALRGLAE